MLEFAEVAVDVIAEGVVPQVVVVAVLSAVLGGVIVGLCVGKAREGEGLSGGPPELKLAVEVIESKPEVSGRGGV